MKLICLFAISSALIWAQGTASEGKRGGTQKRVLDTKASKKLPVEMNAPPASAVKVGDDLYRYVAPDGKKWIFKKTPFGWSKADESQMPAPVKEEDHTRVVGQKGDSVEFERPGPFGSFKWEKKKAELNDSERAALARAQKK